MTGTYSIRLHNAENDFETDTLVLKQDGDTLKGCLTEFMFTVVYLNGGTVDGTRFSFGVFPFLTIYGDNFLGAEGEVNGEQITGTFTTGLGKIPFSGVRTSAFTPYLT